MGQYISKVKSSNNTIVQSFGQNNNFNNTIIGNFYSFDNFQLNNCSNIGIFNNNYIWFFNGNNLVSVYDTIRREFNDRILDNIKNTIIGDITMNYKNIICSKNCIYYYDKEKLYNLIDNNYLELKIKAISVSYEYGYIIYIDYDNNMYHLGTDFKNSNFLKQIEELAHTRIFIDDKNNHIVVESRKNQNEYGPINEMNIINGHYENNLIKNINIIDKLPKNVKMLYFGEKLNVINNARIFKFNIYTGNISEDDTISLDTLLHAFDGNLFFIDNNSHFMKYDITSKIANEICNLNIIDFDKCLITFTNNRVITIGSEKITIYESSGKKMIYEYQENYIRNEMKYINTYKNGSILFSNAESGNFILMRNDTHIYYLYFTLKKTFENYGTTLQKDVFNIIIKYINFDHNLIIIKQKYYE